MAKRVQLSDPESKQKWLPITSISAVYNGNETLEHVLSRVPFLNESGQIPSVYLPSYVDDIMEFTFETTAPTTVGTHSVGDNVIVRTGSAGSYTYGSVIYTLNSDNTWTSENLSGGKIYTQEGSADTYRWTGSTLIRIGGDLGAYIPLAGSSAITGSLTANSNNSIDLGSSSSYWKDIYGTTLHTAAINIYGTGTKTLTLDASDNLTFGGYTVLHSNNSNVNNTDHTVTINSTVLNTIAKATVLTDGTTEYSVGSGINPIYFNNGIPVASSSTLGSATKPLYLNSGTLTEASTYAGGTSVTLNGTSKSGSTATFYAATSAGTQYQFLEANSNGVPAWRSTTVGVAYADVNSGQITFGNPVLVTNDNQIAIQFGTNILSNYLTVPFASWSTYSNYVNGNMVSGVTVNNEGTQLTITTITYDTTTGTPTTTTATVDIAGENTTYDLSVTQATVSNSVLTDAAITLTGSDSTTDNVRIPMSALYNDQANNNGTNEDIIIILDGSF